MIEHLIFGLTALLLGLGVGGWLALRHSHTERAVSGGWLARPRAWLAGAVGSILLLGMGAIVPSLEAGNHVVRLPPNIAAGMGRTNFAFAIAVGHDDSVWLVHHPSARHRERGENEPFPNQPEIVDTFEIMKFEEKSHCYTVKVGGTPQEICPTH